MKTRIIRLLAIILVMLMGAISGQTLGYDARECLTSMYDDVHRLTSDAYNLQATESNGIIYIRQLVPFMNQLAYGERLATLVIDCNNLLVERIAGWELF